MTTPEHCPFCGSHSVVPGHVKVSEGRFGFQPLETRQGFHLTMRAVFAFAFGPEASYCAQCNMLWAKADARDAANFIRKFGTEGLRAQFEAVQANQPPSS